MADSKLDNVKIEQPKTREQKICTSYIIMNADDYGPSDYLNDGIIKGIEKGIINSVSVMVTYQYQPDFMRKLDRLMETINKVDHKVGIGLHLSLNGGKALTKNIGNISRLLRKKKVGYFKGVNQINITKKYVIEAEIELNSQLDFLIYYLRKHGKEIDHLNHHIGFVAFHERLWKCYVRVAQERGLAIRSPRGYMSTTKNFHKDGVLAGSTQEGVRKALEKWISNLITLKPYRNLTDQPLKMFIARKKLMKKRFRYARLQDVFMPTVFNDNYYNEASRKTAINFLQSFKDKAIKEFMLHPAADRPSKGVPIPHGFKRRSLKGRRKELKVLLESNFKYPDGKQVPLADIIRGKSTIINSVKQEIRLQLINYGDLKAISVD